jgi:hypothetical protein
MPHKEKKMAEKIGFLGKLAVGALALGAALSACDNGTTPENAPKKADGQEGGKKTTKTYQTAGLHVNEADAAELSVSGLAASLAWIKTNAVENGVYDIVLGADETLTTQTIDNAALKSKSGVTIRLSGLGQERTIQLSGKGNLFNITADSVTFILGNNITLKGVSSNNRSLVRMYHTDSATTAQRQLIMESGAKITGNKAGSSSSGGGVCVSYGTFTMNGGKIYDNSPSSSGTGGGVYTSDGPFTMNGGEIYDNSSSSGIGGGVYVSGPFTMNGGEIYDNSSSSFAAAAAGGGVYASDGPFTMNGGKIYDNSSSSSSFSFSSYGGGVYVSGPFTMNGGEIYGNTASFSSSYGGGGGVFASSTFIKKGGVIYGYSSGEAKSNKVVQSGVIIQTGGGHAVCAGSKRRETTASSGVNMDSTKSGVAGGWQ